MKYSIIHPDVRLQSHVQYFWTLEVNHDSCQRAIRTFVDDSTGILIEYATSAEAGLPRRTMIYGQTTRPTLNHNTHSFFTLGVLFQPYAIKELFGHSAHELTNQRIGLDDFLQIQLTEVLASKKNQSDKLNILSEYLFKLITRSTCADKLIRYCISYIKQHNGMVTVKDLQEKVGISEKQLERRFKDTIGVSPRHYLKVIRFKQAVELLSKKTDNSLTDITYQLNYFDQSHFIKQTKELSGLSPKRLKKELTASLANLIL
jgi:AraC-like DNA-binding protein